ncbi:MAG TPA: hypothetical protein VFA70_10970, partial [Dehalococcoidia bacterium]|nr:hypothetical protein [Dehalococcoidia bacterium]
VPPTYNESVSASALTIGSTALDSTLITAQLHATAPTGCNPLPGSPYVVCNQDGPPAELDAGAEPGVLTFATTLGHFPNGAQRFDVLCGVPPETAPGLVVPAPGSPAALPRSCTDASVRLTPGGQAGDAVVSVRFAGAVTAAFAVGAIHITITPQPEQLTLHGGCNQVQVPQSVPTGSPVSLVVQLVDPSRAVLGVWRRDAQSGAWQAGYLRDVQAPLQFDEVDPGESLWICLDAAAHFPLS